MTSIARATQIASSFISDSQSQSVHHHSTTSIEHRESNFKVVVRVRPPLKREMPSKSERDDRGQALRFYPITQISESSKYITLLEYLGSEVTEKGRQHDIEKNPALMVHHKFTFDKIYPPDSAQVSVYDQTAKPAVLSVLLGYNATIFAYGQTGTGKTFTMEGFSQMGQDPSRGIIPRSMEEIFNYIQSE